MVCTTLLLILLLTTVSESAGVVSRDLFEPGDGLLTYDDVNQREWLDFSVTAGLSEEELTRSLEQSALLGFKLATKDDALELFEANNNSYLPGESHDWACLFGNAKTHEFDLGNNVTLLATHLSGLTAQDPEGDDEAHSVSFAMQIQAPDFLIDVLPRTYGFAYYPHLCVEQGVPCLQVIGRISDFSNEGLIDVIADLGPPPELETYWLYRDAAPVPEPTTAFLSITASLVAWRIRVFA